LCRNPTVARNLARQQGWYAERRKYLAIFMAVLTLASVMMLLMLAFMFRFVGTAERLALMGAVVVLIFVLVIAASFHHMDAYIYGRQFGMQMNLILEWSGIAIIFFTALFCQMRNKKR